MSIYNKVKSILGVLIIFIIIITTNLVDKNNFNRVKQTVVNIYQDRLIANNIIFEISKNIHLKEKEVLLNNSARLSSKDDIINSSIENLIFDFEQTKLTIEEAKTLTNLKDNIKLLFDLENKNIENPSHDLKSKMMMKFSEIDKNLIKLSKIQINEGRRQFFIGKKAVSTIELFTQIEIGILVLLAITIQLIIIYEPKKRL